MEELTYQLLRLVVLAVPIAWIAWTFTKEEVFREVREYFQDHSRNSRTLFVRKFFYLFTCEYCFSHWVTLGLLFVYQYKLAFDDWRGYVVGYSALVWVANVYMSLYLRLRVDIRKERADADETERKIGRTRAA